VSNVREKVVLIDSQSGRRKTHIVGENGRTLCGFKTKRTDQNEFWSYEYSSSAAKCTCKNCLDILECGSKKLASAPAVYINPPKPDPPLPEQIGHQKTIKSTASPRQRKDRYGNPIDVWETLISVRNEGGEVKRIPVYGNTRDECEANKQRFISELLPNIPQKDKVQDKISQAMNFISKGRAPKARQNGEGTLFQRSGDGLWVARIPIGRREDGSLNTVQLYGKTMQVLEEKVKPYAELNEKFKQEHKDEYIMQFFEKLTRLISDGVAKEKREECEASRRTADIMGTMFNRAKERNQMSIERKPEDKPRFEKLRDTADLLEVGYEEFAGSFNSPEVKALAVLTKVNISPNAEYMEILKQLPHTIRNIANDLEKSDGFGAYTNFANDIYKTVRQYRKILKQEIE
jgi:hypothetical protein